MRSIRPGRDNPRDPRKLQAAKPLAVNATRDPHNSDACTTEVNMIRAIAGYTIDPSPDRRLGREDGLLARDELEGGGALGNVKLGLIHVRLNRRKERSREVTLTSVRQHRKDHRTLCRTHTHDRVSSA